MAIKRRQQTSDISSTRCVNLIVYRTATIVTSYVRAIVSILGNQNSMATRIYVWYHHPGHGSIKSEPLPGNAQNVLHDGRRRRAKLTRDRVTCSATTCSAAFLMKWGPVPVLLYSPFPFQLLPLKMTSARFRFHLLAFSTTAS